jgi:hypothetical protein
MVQTFLLRIPGAARPYYAGSGGIRGLHVRKSPKMAVIFDSRADAQHKADELNKLPGARRFFVSHAGTSVR